MYVLLIIGIVLVIFGALVLVKLPDKAGGKVTWLGVEISSTGAGLPLIVLGVVTMTLASTLSNNGSPSPLARPGVPEQHAGSDQIQGPVAQAEGGQSGRIGCFQRYFQDVPLGNTPALNAGVKDRDAIQVDQLRGEPFGLQFNQFGVPVGAMRLIFFPADRFFKIQSIVDAQCQQVDTYENHSDPGRSRWNIGAGDTLRLKFGNDAYSLTVEGREKTIRISFEAAP